MQSLPDAALGSAGLCWGLRSSLVASHVAQAASWGARHKGSDAVGIGCSFDLVHGRPGVAAGLRRRFGLGLDAGKSAMPLLIL